MISPTSSVPVPIELMQPEGEGIVVDVAGAHSNVHRLEEMGIRCGCRIRMLCPGQTCMVAVDGKKMCLRLGSVAEILVSPLVS